MKNFFPRYSLLAILLAFVVAAFLALGWFRTVVTEMEILLVPVDPRSAALATQTVETLSEDMKTVAFYDQLVKQYPSQSEAWDQMTAEEKRAWWQSRITTERVKNSGIVKVTLTGSSATQLQTLAKEVTDVLQTEPKRLYGDTNAVMVSVLEQPISTTRLVDPFGWLVATLSFGVVFSALLVTALRGLRSIGTRSSMMAESFSIAPKPVKFAEPVVPAPSATESMPAEVTTKQSFEVKRPTDPFLASHRKNERGEGNGVAAATVLPSTTLTSVVVEPQSVPERAPVSAAQKTAMVAQPELTVQHTPGNLPFVENFSWEAALPGLKVTHHSEEPSTLENDDVPAAPTNEAIESNQTFEESAPAAVEATPAAPIKSSEPTEEELKRRLNQLLRGEL